MLREWSVANFTLVGYAVSGGAGLLQEVLHQINRVVQKIGVVRADVEVDLALQIWSERHPIPLQYSVQVVVFAPVLGCLVVDHASPLVENRLWIAVLGSWRKHRLPDVELLTRAAAIAQRSFIGDIVTH